MRVLLAVDGSAPSQAAVDLVRGLPLPAGSRILILSVAEEPALLGEFAAVDYWRVAEDLRREAESVLKRAASALIGLETVETAVRAGDPRKEIVAEAKTWRPDLIVMGSHGRTGLRRLFMGSVAEYVVRHAPCTVEIARGPAPSEPLHP